MRRVSLYMNMTFDGFLSGPHNEPDWFKPGQDDAMNQDILRTLDSRDSLMMGHPTAPEMMLNGGRWESRKRIQSGCLTSSMRWVTNTSL